MLKVETMVTGKDLRGKVLLKVLSEDLKMRDFQYKLGMNEDIQPLATEGTCEAGLHFTKIEDICKFVDYGTKLAIVHVPDEEPVYVDDGKFRSHRLVVEKVMDLWTVETLQWVHEHGADITARDNYAIRCAAGNGYLEVVKYLHEHGADITDCDNDAVRWAAENGHLEVVKYLHEHGADITDCDNDAVCCAAGNGHLDVVKYLHEHGADITDCDNDAVRVAKAKGHQEVVDYLLANGAKLPE